MGSGTYERSGARISTSASSGYEFVRFPNGEIWHDGGNPDVSDGYAELYFEIGFYVDTGNFYGATFHAEGSSADTFAVYGPNVYNLHGWTIQVPWNGYRHFWEKTYYNSYSSGYNESVVDFNWYPTLPTYTIQYNANGGTGAPSAQTKEYGTSIALSSDVPTKTNYKFLGWSDGTRTYQPGGQYSRNIGATLTAIWELDFVPPTAVLEAHRTTRITSDNDDPNGEFGYASLVWILDQTKGENVGATITAVESNSAQVTFEQPLATATSGTTEFHWSLPANSSCSLTVTITDGNGVSTVKTVLVSSVNRAVQAIYDSSTQRKYIKLGEPLMVESGGTGGATAAAARASLLIGDFYGAEILWDNPANEPGWGTSLSKPCTDYKLLVVVCKDNDGAIVPPVIVPDPAIGKQFNVTSVYPGASGGVFYLKSTTFKITSTTMIEWGKDGSNWMVGEFGIRNGGNAWSYTFRHAPILVIGIKA